MQATADCTTVDDTQTPKGCSGSVSVGPLGPGAPKVSFEPSKHLWQVWALILNVIMSLLPLLSCWGFSFAPGYGFVCLVFFFLVGSNILLLVVVQQGVAIL